MSSSSTNQAIPPHSAAPVAALSQSNGSVSSPAPVESARTTPVATTSAVTSQSQEEPMVIDEPAQARPSTAGPPTQAEPINVDVSEHPKGARKEEGEMPSEARGETEDGAQDGRQEKEST